MFDDLFTISYFRRNWSRSAKAGDDEQTVGAHYKIAITRADCEGGQVDRGFKRAGVYDHEVVSDSLHFCKVHTHIPSAVSIARFPLKSIMTRARALLIEGNKLPTVDGFSVLLP